MAVDHDAYELNKLLVDLPPVPAAEMDLLMRIDHNGMSFQENSTTVQGDFSDNNTVILDNYGEIHLMFYIHPNSKTWFQLANDQIMGKWPAGEKPTGSITRSNHAGDALTTWNVERYYIQSFRVGPMNSKESSVPMEMNITIRPEKFVCA